MTTEDAAIDKMSESKFLDMLDTIFKKKLRCAYYYDSERIRNEKILAKGYGDISNITFQYSDGSGCSAGFCTTYVYKNLNTNKYIVLSVAEYCHRAYTDVMFCDNLDDVFIILMWYGGYDGSTCDELMCRTISLYNDRPRAGADLDFNKIRENFRGNLEYKKMIVYKFMSRYPGMFSDLLTVADWSCF